MQGEEQKEGQREVLEPSDTRGLSDRLETKCIIHNEDDSAVAEKHKISICISLTARSTVSGGIKNETTLWVFL